MGPKISGYNEMVLMLMWLLCWIFMHNYFSGVSVVDRNGSLETNESSSPEANQSDLDIRQNKTPPTQLNKFDFNEFFNIDNIPGLTVPVSL